MKLREMQEGATRMVMSTALCEAVLQGKINKLEYIRYLSDVYCYASHSPKVIAMAGARLTSTHPFMADYLFRHASEEIGYDTWARSDLLDLGIDTRVIDRLQPSSACLRMIALEYLYAHHLNPVGLFGWMFMLESLGGRVGVTLVASIEKALNVEGKALYFLNGHTQSDSSQSEALFHVISENVVTDPDKTAFIRMFDESLRAYCDMLGSAREVGRQ